MRLPQFFTLTLLLGVATATVYLRPDVDRVPPSDPLSQMPQQMQRRISYDVPITQEQLQLLGKGEFLNRIYAPANATPDAAFIGLFIAYFPTQRTGQAIHSPQNCLPGAGWAFASSRYISIPNLPGNVGEYVVTNGMAKELILYWYQAHGQSIANDYRAKASMMFDAIRYDRTDGALIRISTPIGQHESEDSAHDRAVAFASNLATMLPRYIPN